MHYSSPLTLMEAIFAEGRVAVILFLVQISDGDNNLEVCSVGTGGEMGVWGNSSVCMTGVVGGMYVGWFVMSISGIGWTVDSESALNV